MKGLANDGERKKTRVRLGGSLKEQEAHDLLDQKAVGEQVAQEIRQNGDSAGGSRTKIQCCGVCGKPGHNARTCKEAAESSDSSVSNSVIVISQCCGCVIEDSCGGLVEKWSLACSGRSLIMYVRVITFSVMTQVWTGPTSNYGRSR